jgi:hypothetical protein
MRIKLEKLKYKDLLKDHQVRKFQKYFILGSGITGKKQKISLYLIISFMINN